MTGQTRGMLNGYAAADGRHRETVINDSNVHHGSLGHVPIDTAIHPCGKGPISALLGGSGAAVSCARGRS